MSLSAESRHRATQAIIDALDLLGMANAAVHRARSELGGEAHHLTSKMSAQLTMLREVAELLAHEVQKGHATARLAVVPVTSRSRAA
jgi:hypothetical protein